MPQKMMDTRKQGQKTMAFKISTRREGIVSTAFINILEYDVGSGLQAGDIRDAREGVVQALQ